MRGPKVKFVRQAIAKDKVVIFSKSYCTCCKMAKEQFNKLEEPFALYELNLRDDVDESEIQNILGEMTGARTLPRVFVKGKCIGGGTDVKKMYEDGSLAKLLKLK